MNLLDKVRKLNEVLQAYETVSIPEITEVLSDVENANVYCVNEKGLVLGYKQLLQCLDEEKFVVIQNDKYLPEMNTRFLANVIKTEIIPAKNEDEVIKNTVIVPIYTGHKRLGSLLIEYMRKDVKNDALVLAEFTGTILGGSIVRANSVKNEQMKMIMVAMETLSYSETMAVKAIFAELEGLEGYLVASKIADKSKITRSVIVNALRKLESAGVIETRSLGMKGTYIRVIVPMIMDEIK
ncbi:MAG: GTP-sensing pleiotropic transcriptional regulator CodY [Phascolarctobacterium sp.]|nr:GTP-sensing pleiotropic transcriptional regulator CodY [Phascolarctobacterium sp.]